MNVLKKMSDKLSDKMSDKMSNKITEKEKVFLDTLIRQLKEKPKLVKKNYKKP